MLEVLAEREKLNTTGIGEGVAIPHGKLAGLPRLYASFGVARDGVDFSSIDGTPTQLFFALVAPENSAGIAPQGAGAHLAAVPQSVIPRGDPRGAGRRAHLRADRRGRRPRVNLVIRPVHDVFLEEVAFPAFAVGVVDAASGLGKLLESVADERVAWLLGRVLDRTVGGSFFGLVDDEWLELVHVLLFSEWERRRDGWHVARPSTPATRRATSLRCTWR